MCTKINLRSSAVLANSDQTWKAPADVAERMPLALSTEIGLLIDHIIKFVGQKCLAIKCIAADNVSAYMGYHFLHRISLT